ncbi:hypothetical protein ACFL4U_04215 [Candidatus Neomarinimicrobiota bacterium]
MLSALQRLLPMAEKVVDRRTSLPILKQICVQKGKARVTDLETMLVIPVPDKRSYTMPVQLLKKVLTTRPSSLEILLEENGKASVQYDGQRLTFQSKDVAEFPAIIDREFESLGVWPREVLQTLLSMSSYASQDELKPSLNGIFIEEKNGHLEASATDGHVLRLEQELVVKDGTPFKCIIPVKPLQVLARWARGDTRVGMSQTHLRFSLPGKVVLYTRIINEKYPEIKSVIPAEDTFTGKAILDREKALTLVNAAKPFLEKPANLSILSLNGQISQILVENTEENTQWQADLPVGEHDGQGIRIGFDLTLLEKALKGLEGDQVLWCYTAPVSASVFRNIEEQNGSLTLLMPIRITEEEVTHEQERGD